MKTYIEPTYLFLVGIVAPVISNTDFWILTAIMAAVGGIGGAVRYFASMPQANFGRILTTMAIGTFASVLVGWVCEWREIEQPLTLFLGGLAGWAGRSTLEFLEQKVKSSMRTK